VKGLDVSVIWFGTKLGDGGRHSSNNAVDGHCITVTRDVSVRAAATRPTSCKRFDVIDGALDGEESNNR